MLKLFGALMTFFACAALGVWLQRRLIKRVQVLDSILGAFAMLRTEISFLQTPLLSATEKIAAATKDALFTKLHMHLRGGKLPSDAMQGALSELGCVLTNTDAAVLLRLSLQLGSSDAESQVQQIDAALEQLRLQRINAQEAVNTNGRLYLASGMLLGVLLVLLML